MVERAIEQRRLFRQAPGDEAAPDPRVAGRREFSLEPVAVAVTAADDPKSARRAHRGGELAVRHHVHRREQHRMLDAEQRRDAG